MSNGTGETFVRRMLNRLRRRRFLLTIIVSFLLVWCIPVITMITGNVSNIAAMEESAEETYRNMLTQFSRSIDAKLAYVRGVMLQISGEAKLAKLLPRYGTPTAEDRYDINQIIKSNASYFLPDTLLSEIYIYINRSETIITSTTVYSGTLFDMTVTSIEGMTPTQWFASACEEGMLYDGIRRVRVVKNNVEREAVFCIQSLPLNYGSSVNGLLVIELDQSKIASAMGGIGNQFDVYMLTPAREVIYASNEALPQLAKACEVEVGVSSVSTSNGEEYTLIRVPEDTYRLDYVAVASMPQYMQRVLRYQNSMTLQLTVCVVASILLIVMLTRRNYNPINKILRKASSVAAPGQDEAHTEMEYISTSFDLAISRQEQLRSELDDVVRDKAQTDRMYQENQRGMYSNLIMALVTGKVDKYDDPDSIMEHFDIRFTANGFLSLQIFLYPRDPAGKLADNAYKDALARCCVQMKRALSADDHFCCAIPMGNSLAAALVNFPLERQAEAEATIGRVCAELSDSLIQSGLCVAVGVSNAVNSMMNVDICYQQAQAALEHNLLVSCENMFLYRDICSSDKGYDYPIETEQRLIELMLLGDLKNARELLSRVYEENLIHRSLQPQMAYYAFMDIACTLTKTIGMLNADAGYIDADNEITMNRLSECKRAEQFRYEIDRVVENICTLATRSRDENQKKLKKRIAEYIEDNYTNVTMSQQSVAEAMNISASYLSKYFKQEYHENMLTYVNRKRIALAKQLLATTDLLQEDIASRTGFGSNKTLIRVFKQYEGITPGFYRATICGMATGESEKN